MQSLKEKLHSAKGSSLLITMVYFLLCFFVGGVVLTAATSNGGRLAAIKADRQAAYAQRSAAMVVQDALTDKDLKLVIEKETTTTRVTTTNGATTISTTVGYRLNFVGNENASVLENIVQQAATSVYLDQVWKQEGTPLTFQNLTVGEAQVTARNMLYGATDTMDFTVEGMTLTGAYVSKHSSDEEFGTFVIQFKGPAAEDTCRISLEIPATVDTRREPSSVKTDVVGNTRIDETVEIEKTTITWSNPLIRKGAVK